MINIINAYDSYFNSVDEMGLFSSTTEDTKNSYEHWKFPFDDDSCNLVSDWFKTGSAVICQKSEPKDHDFVLKFENDEFLDDFVRKNKSLLFHCGGYDVAGEPCKREGRKLILRVVKTKLSLFLTADEAYYDRMRRATNWAKELQLERKEDRYSFFRAVNEEIEKDVERWDHVLGDWE